MFEKKLIENYMRFALREALYAYENDEVPVGAVVVHESRIIGKGYNQRESLKDPTAHAEMIAITAAANTLGTWRLNNCAIFVTKEPCPMCAGAIMNARLSNVYYGVEDEQSGCCGSLYQLCRDPRFNHQAVVTGGILHEQCRQLLQDFFLHKRKSNDR